PPIELSELRLRGLQRHAPLEAPNNIRATPIAALRVLLLLSNFKRFEEHRERIEPLYTLGRDADDRPWLAVDADHATDDLGIRSIARSPERLRQHQHIVAAYYVFVCASEASEQR